MTGASDLRLANAYVDLSLKGFDKLKTQLSGVRDYIKNDLMPSMDSLWAKATGAVSSFSGSPLASNTLQKSFQLLAVTIGREAVPYVMRFAAALQQVRQYIVSMDPETRKTVAGYAAWAVGIAGVVAAFRALTVALGTTAAMTFKLVGSVAKLAYYWYEVKKGSEEAKKSMDRATASNESGSSFVKRAGDHGFAPGHAPVMRGIAAAEAIKDPRARLNYLNALEEENRRRFKRFSRENQNLVMDAATVGVGWVQQAGAYVADFLEKDGVKNQAKIDHFKKFTDPRVRVASEFGEVGLTIQKMKREAASQADPWNWNLRSTRQQWGGTWQEQMRQAQPRMEEGRRQNRLMDMLLGSPGIGQPRLGDLGGAYNQLQMQMLQQSPIEAEILKVLQEGNQIAIKTQEEIKNNQGGFIK